jgi:hypothetical protein
MVVCLVVFVCFFLVLVYSSCLVFVFFSMTWFVIDIEVYFLCEWCEHSWVDYMTYSMNF